MEILKDKVYKHFKGDYYLVVDIANHSETKEKYLRWKKRVGAEHIPDVFISKRPDGSYAPMSLSELRRYTKMFSVFLGKEFIIC